ncbi:response regulator transcription factor (plasmid) [Streptomyces sp. QH1-20]|uniref:response regulator transcription factor n=1 Tax=Streptomyces sp. QH1-20 TaxID=3240934 RepID=UPI0035186C31
MNSIAELHSVPPDDRQQPFRNTVLVADGDQVFRTRLCRLLESLGYNVVAEASNAVEVTKLLRSTGPELVVMDLPLARSVGLRTERLGGLLRRPPKVVLLTDDAAHDGLAEALDAGARGFITKDLDAALLDPLLDHVLSGGCAIAPELFGLLMDRPTGSGTRFARVHPRLSLLNDNERLILQLLGCGFENARIAEELHLSRASVKTYVSRLLGKLHLENRTQAALVANETGLASRPPSPHDPNKRRRLMTQ